MAEITTEDREMTVTDADGIKHKVMGKVTTTRDGVDENGVPNVSVNVSVPPITVGAVPGKAE